ncbi:MAG: quinone oxidoreductase [Alphaproteobacteria bacterium]|nr:quinone oxidoreductase [Alphaproteobacteria bacterium]
MAKAIRLHQAGNPDQMHWEDIAMPTPKAGEVLLRQTAVGLNYIDIYHRSGLYPLSAYPAILGLEACGEVEALGDGVSNIAIGDRVAYGGGPMGAYAEYRTIPSQYCAKIPDAISNTQAAASMVQGITAHFLVQRTVKLKAGDSCLIHAAAGGVGTLLCQWAKHMGVTVLGTVSSEEKAAHASAHGCDHPIIYTQENVVDRVQSLTQGQGVNVVYDSVGKDTFMASLDCLRMFGTLVSFGQASGPVPPFDISLLALKGSLYLCRPNYMNYTQDNVEYHRAIQAMFGLIEQGVLKVEIGQTYPLAQAAQAHRDLESRKTTGATVLCIE